MNETYATQEDLRPIHNMAFAYIGRKERRKRERKREADLRKENKRLRMELRTANLKARA